ncbi:hypothetical protein H4I95_02721 [Botrytis cinerea]
MSNPTNILIEKLKLRCLLRERVFVKWEDQSGAPCTLGSRLKRNGQNLEFFLAAYHDEEGRIHIHFSLKASIILGGDREKIEMFLSRLDASAIHDAGLSDSVHVICLQFDLSTKGFIVTKGNNAANATIKPRNYTSKELICGLESLSDTKTFTVYIKPNDYAMVGLEEIRDRLSNSPIDIHKTNINEIYTQQVPELVEWNKLGSMSLLPPYTRNPQLFTELQAPRSLPVLEQETSSVNIVSHDCEGLLDIQVNLDDIENDPRYIEMNFGVDSDEEQLAKEQLANLDSRGLNQQLDYDSKVSQALNSKVSQALDSRLLKWIQTAIRINSNVHEHKHLTIKFSILAKLIRWANGIHHGIEMGPALKQFMRLGDAARTTALDRRCNRDEYYDQKGVCITRVLTEFSKLGNSDSRENKSVCEKRKSLEAHCTASKLTKM